jgi:hypothetical protein
MNEQIYKIARQSDALAREIEPDLREIVRYNRIRDEKFAELIVQECCDVADQVERADMDSYVSKYIRAHFGVEE